MVYRNAVRDHRIAAGLTLRELAARSNLSPAMVHAVETGKRSLSDRAKARMADALGVGVVTLFFPDFVAKQTTNTAFMASA